MSTIPDDVKQKIEAKYWLSTKHVPKERFQNAAIFGYQLSRGELEAKDKEIAKLKIFLEAQFRSAYLESGMGSNMCNEGWLQFCKDNGL